MTHLRDVNDLYEWERRDGSDLEFARRNKKKQNFKEDVDPNLYTR